MSQLLGISTGMRGPSRFAARLATLGAVYTAVYLALIRPWHTRWGATDEEVRHRLPGDDEVPHPWMASTRAIAIDAPAAAVWTWLVQMGCGRAGWYSCDRIDNRGVHSAETILPEHQQLRVGDFVPEGPEVGWTVAATEPNRLLLLVSHGVMKGADWCERDSSWAFVLDPVDNKHTRLIERSRTGMNRSWRTALAYLILEPGDFVMARKQMLSIKRRVERPQQGSRGQAA